MQWPSSYGDRSRQLLIMAWLSSLQCMSSAGLAVRDITLHDMRLHMHYALCIKLQLKKESVIVEKRYQDEPAAFIYSLHIWSYSKVKEIFSKLQVRRHWQPGCVSTRWAILHTSTQVNQHNGISSLSDWGGDGRRYETWNSGKGEIAMENREREGVGLSDGGRGKWRIWMAWRYT